MGISNIDFEVVPATVTAALETGESLSDVISKLAFDFTLMALAAVSHLNPDATSRQKFKVDGEEIEPFLDEIIVSPDIGPRLVLFRDLANLNYCIIARLGDDDEWSLDQAVYESSHDGNGSLLGFQPHISTPD